MARTLPELNKYFNEYLGRNANEQELKIYATAPEHRLVYDLGAARAKTLGRTGTTGTTGATGATGMAGTTTLNTSIVSPATPPVVTTNLGATFNGQNIDDKITAARTATYEYASPTKFTETLKTALQNKYDDDLRQQEVALRKQLYGQGITPEEFRVLSPSQQNAIRNADKAGVQAQLTSVMNAVAARGKSIENIVETSGNIYEEQAKLNMAKLEDLISERDRGVEMDEKKQANYMKLVSDILDSAPEVFSDMTEAERNALKEGQILDTTIEKMATGLVKRENEKSASTSGEVTYNYGNLPAENTKSYIANFGDGQVTGYGSSLWQPGLDYSLTGGKGAQVTVPFSGTVVDVVSGFQSVGPNNVAGQQQNGGFGNQVKILTNDGKYVWISHLNNVYVKPGDKVGPAPGGTGPVKPIGSQGNTGYTLGDTGVHLDLTMSDYDIPLTPANAAEGRFWNPKDVYAYFDKNVVKDAVIPETVNFDMAKKLLEASKGADGYANTELFMKLLTKRATGFSESAFKAAFSSMLNPEDPTAQPFIAKKSATEIEAENNAALMQSLIDGSLNI